MRYFYPAFERPKASVGFTYLAFRPPRPVAAQAVNLHSEWPPSRLNVLSTCSEPSVMAQVCRHVPLLLRLAMGVLLFGFALGGARLNAQNGPALGAPASATPAAQNVSHILASQTPRRRRSDPSGTSKARSRQSEDSSRSRWLVPSCAVRVAKPFNQNRLTADRRDAVELGGPGAHAGERFAKHRWLA